MRPNGESSSPQNGAAELSRREELLAVATKLFAARGYHGTRMDDVADVVGLNKATVYHYYASKSLILFDIYEGAADSTVAAVHDDPSWSAREAIYHFTRRLLVNIAERPRGCGGVLPGEPVHHRVVHRGAGRLRPREGDPGLRARARRDRPRHRQRRVLRVRLPRAGARLHRDDAGRVPLAAPAGAAHRAGDRRRVQHRAAARADPRSRPCGWIRRWVPRTSPTPEAK